MEFITPEAILFQTKKLMMATVRLTSANTATISGRYLPIVITKLSKCISALILVTSEESSDTLVVSGAEQKT